MYSPFRTAALCGALSGLLLALPALIEAFTGETSATSVLFALSPRSRCPCSPRCTAGRARSPAASGTSPTP